MPFGLTLHWDFLRMCTCGADRVRGFRSCCETLADSKAATLSYGDSDLCGGE
jgi:hypothetical protein